MDTGKPATTGVANCRESPPPPYFSDVNSQSQQYTQMQPVSTGIINSTMNQERGPEISESSMPVRNLETTFSATNTTHHCNGLSMPVGATSTQRLWVAPVSCGNVIRHKKGLWICVVTLLILPLFALRIFFYMLAIW